MIRIDMTEEPEDEMDLIFKAQNIFYDNKMEYVVPVKFLGDEKCYISPYSHKYKGILNRMFYK